MKIVSFNNKCFTLVEVLVVLGIISLLTLLVLPQYRKGEGSLALQRAAHQLAQDIRRTQEMATSATETNGVPPRYGIEFDLGNPNQYFLFADINDNGTYQPPDEVVETINLERRVSLHQILVGDPPSSKTDVSITFSPPDPTTEIRGPGGPFSVALIQLTGEGQVKSIKVNEAGLIYVE
jgi:type II secretory pathway pseudopilin PulG